MSKETISFEQLPSVVAELSRQQKQILDILLNGKPQASGDQWLSFQDVLNYLPEKPAKQTVYHWVAAKEIPFHKRGKHLYFLKSEIDTWLKSGRKKTMAEIKDQDHAA